jgi:hypothetical protein
LLSGLVAQPPFSSPAHWDYHPRSGRDLGASAVVGDGRLYVNALGERWLSQPKAPFAQVAPALAKEPLVSVVDLGQDGWLFVGALGATYAARSPLGDFTSVTHPPVPMAEVAVAGTVLLGVTRTQGLQRSVDRGHTWQEVPIEGRAVDVALTHHGAGLLLLAPERLLATTDFGEHWQATTDDAFGALALDGEGTWVRVKGVLESRSFTPGREPAWQRTGQQTEAPPSLDGGRRVKANSVHAGRAVFIDGQYFELEREDKRWLLWFGSDVDVLGSRVAHTFDECTDLRLAGSREALVAVCSAGGDGVAPLKLWTSADRGTTWRQESQPLHGNIAAVTLTVLAGGRWVIGGICPPEVAGAGCVPRGVYTPRDPATTPRSEPYGQAPAGQVPAGQVPAGQVPAGQVPAGQVPGDRLRAIAVPLLDRSPLALGASADGKRLLVLGGRTKGKSLFAFTSDEQLGDFHVEKLIDVSTDWSGSNIERGPAPTVGRISTGPDGRFGVTVFDRGQGRWALLVLEADGRLSSLGRAPTEDATVAASGAFALAVDPLTTEAWESLDGGVSWDDIGHAPSALCAGDTPRCSPALVCWTKGCVAEGRYSRIGWRGQAGVETRVSAPSTDPLAAQNTEEFGTTVGCRFTEDSEWNRYPGARLPSASQAQLGEVSWFSVDLDLERSAAASYVATDKGGSKAVRVALLEPHPVPRETALAAQLQVEGAAALRVSAGQAPEVAWHNFFDGIETERGRLPKDVTVPTRATRWDAKQAEPGLLSVSQKGLFVRPDAPTKEAVTYLVSGGKTQTLPPLAWPRIDSTSRAEMVFTDGTPLGLTVIDAGAALVRVRLNNGRWTRDAMTLGLLRPQRFDIRQAFDLAYSAGVPGFHLMFLDTSHSTSWWFPFAAGDEPLGTGIEVPTQRDLPPKPAACGMAERASSPRVIVPAERGTRHAVVITHTTEPISVLRTEEAVLFGVPGRPCVAAYEARPPHVPVGSEAVALIAPDAARGSWFFRRAAGSEEFEARRMSCQFDAGLEVPIEVTGAR